MRQNERTQESDQYDRNDPVAPEGDAAVSAPDTSLANTWTRINGIPLLWFFAFMALILLAAFQETLPATMIGGFGAIMMVGWLCWWIGDRVPFLNNFGLSTVTCVLIPAFLMTAGVFPETLSDNIAYFTADLGFIDWLIAGLIAGSILGMPRAILLKAGARLAVPIIGGILVTFSVVGTVGAVIGFGFRDAILFVAGPIMGGGIGAGAVPMSQMYEQQLGGTASEYITLLVPAVVLGNILTIFIAGIYNRMTYKGQQYFVGFNGNGDVIRVKGNKTDFSMRPRATTGDLGWMGIGLLLSSLFFIAGTVLAGIIPGLHSYAWTILLAALFKIFGWLPQRFEDSVANWYGFLAASMVPAILVGVSVTYLDVEELVDILQDPAYLGLAVVTVASAAIVSGVLGWLVKMYAIETSIFAGLGMADMGGSGDLAVVSAANRLDLMPFMQISSRLGGAFTLLLLSVLIPILPG